MHDEYTVRYSNSTSDLDRLKVLSVNGKNNTIKISGKVTIRNHLRVNFINCRDSVVEIGDGCSIGGLQIFMFSAGNHLKIGRRCTFGQDNEIELGDGITNNRDTPIHIGDDCMFAKRTIIKNADGHPIVDRKTKRQINAPRSGVFLGDHVWIGLNATILKGVTIGDCSVIAANALVTKDVPANTTVVGTNKCTPSSGIWSRGTNDLLYSEALYYFYKSFGFEHEDISALFSRHADTIGPYREAFLDAVVMLRQCDIHSPAFLRAVARQLEGTNRPAAAAFFQVAEEGLSPRLPEPPSRRRSLSDYVRRIRSAYRRG